MVYKRICLGKQPHIWRVFIRGKRDLKLDLVDALYFHGALYPDIDTRDYLHELIGFPMPVYPVGVSMLLRPEF